MVACLFKRQQREKQSTYQVLGVNIAETEVVCCGRRAIAVVTQELAETTKHM